jgi:hypothetical protein
MKYLALFYMYGRPNFLIGIYSQKEVAQNAINNHVRENILNFEIDRLNQYEFYIFPLNEDCDYNVNFDYLYQLYRYNIPEELFEELTLLKKQKLNEKESNIINNCYTIEHHNSIVSKFNQWLQIQSQSIYYPVEDYRQSFLTLLNDTKNNNTVPDLNIFMSILNNIYWNHPIYNQAFKDEIVCYLDCWYKYKNLNN